MRARKLLQSVLDRLFPGDPLAYTERDFTDELALAANELLRNRNTQLYLHNQIEYWERMAGKAIADVLTCEDKIAELRNTIHFLRNIEREHVALVARITEHNQQFPEYRIDPWPLPSQAS